ncbi:alpha/beta hydrolase [Parenemella sanctibonifatiensis]|uniref:Alpha/beta hydrolase n=1 Tax=Parenemella sanctibonifatiensis TaxID=2016505 RepID=A0A255EEF3_9ACTN|nr:alpha/beta hydrolase [Parenemella sanctibonifatiensis]OYN87782.1 hypothetical protein CGZ92_05810 [Parenemella sanctibonifatiensis]
MRRRGWLALSGVLSTVLLALVIFQFVPRATEAADPQPPKVQGAVAKDQAPVATAAQVYPEPQMKTLRLPEGDLDYCSNGDLTDLSAVNEIVISVHGLDQDSCRIAGSALDSAERAKARNVLVVSPFFRVKERPELPRQLRWTFLGWSQGDDAIGTDLSSFEVVEQIIRKAGTIPVTVVGFSGGGQFTHRLAVTSRVEAHRYVVVNPSSYLYLDRTRPFPIEGCPGFNDYRYGLEKPNRYVSHAGSATSFTARFGTRNVVYLLGERDNDPQSKSMDATCAARAQGPNRLIRGKQYFAYLQELYGAETLARTQQLLYVPDAGHNHHDMFVSDPGAKAIYG